MKSKSVVLALGSHFFAAIFGPPAAAQICPFGNERVALDNRYIDHGDGTVTDQKTNLMWKKCSEGQVGVGCSGAPSFQPWQTALTSASNSNFGGRGDWRLPSVKELESLIETGCHSPAINTARFPTAPNSEYWTSTSVLDNSANAWIVRFEFGVIDFDVSKSDAKYVRLVRAGN
ncbi:MAG: DUF1566 domain-containing protein [Burkholderiales bacterium]